MAKKIIYITA